MIKAPWAPEQVAALTRFQQSGRYHPYTCGADHNPPQAPALVATVDGWKCPAPDCGYTQDWAHEAMVMLAPEPSDTLLPEEFRQRVVQNLAAEAYACDGVSCGLGEQQCWDAHELRWTATVGGVVHLEGSTAAIADVVLRVCQELGLIRPE